MFRLEITQGPRGTCTFALHEGGRARLVSPEYADHERCVDAVRRLIYALRGDAESELLAELERDAPLLGALRAWASSHEQFAIKRVTTRPRSRARGSRAPSYELDPAPEAGAPGVVSYRSARDGLYRARVHNAAGCALLATPGFTRAYRRDANLRLILELGGDETRYVRRRDGERWYLALRSRSNRVLARSGWFDSRRELDDALSRVLVIILELATGDPAPRDEDPVSLDRDALSRPGAPGIERVETDAYGFWVRLNDASGVAILWSHRYRSATSRERGVRALLLALVIGEGLQYAQDDRGEFVRVIARNNRQLARSRSFADRDELDQALEHLRVALTPDAARLGVLARGGAQLLTASSTATSGSPARSVESTQTEGGVDGRTTRVAAPERPRASSEANTRSEAARGRARIAKSTDSSSLAEVVDRLLDRGVVLDVWSRVSVVGVQLVSIEARVVIASSATYLRYAEAIGLTAAAASPRG